MGKNRYLIADKNHLQTPDIVYCRGAKTPEDVMKYGLPSKTYTGKFHKNNHIHANGGGIINDDNLYTLIDTDGLEYIFQYCGEVIDVEGAIVPDTHYIRRVGMVLRGE